MTIKMCLLDVLRHVVSINLGASLDLEPEGNGNFRFTIVKNNGTHHSSQMVRAMTHNDDIRKLIHSIVPEWDGTMELV